MIHNHQVVTCFQFHPLTVFSTSCELCKLVRNGGSLDTDDVQAALADNRHKTHGPTHYQDIWNLALVVKNVVGVKQHKPTEGRTGLNGQGGWVQSRKFTICAHFCLLIG